MICLKISMLQIVFMDMDDIGYAQPQDTTKGDIVRSKMFHTHDQNHLYNQWYEISLGWYQNFNI